MEFPLLSSTVIYLSYCFPFHLYLEDRLSSATVYASYPYIFHNTIVVLDFSYTFMFCTEFVFLLSYPALFSGLGSLTNLWNK